MKEKLNQSENEKKIFQIELDKLKVELQDQLENTTKWPHAKICEAKKIHKMSQLHLFIGLRLKSQSINAEFLAETIHDTSSHVWNESFDFMYQENHCAA